MEYIQALGTFKLGRCWVRDFRTAALDLVFLP